MPVTPEPRSPTVSPALRPFCVLGVRVDAVQIPGVVARMEAWIRERAACHLIGYRGFLASRSRLPAYIAHYSPAASLLHKIL